MVCQACGASVVDGVHFCSKCGAQVVAAQPMYAAYPPPPVPMLHAAGAAKSADAGHSVVRVRGVPVIGGLMGMFFLRMFSIAQLRDGWPFGNHYHGALDQPWMGALLPFIAVYTVVMAALAVFVGYSLLTRRPWGRTLAIVVGF